MTLSKKSWEVPEGISPLRNLQFEHAMYRYARYRELSVEEADEFVNWVFRTYEVNEKFHEIDIDFRVLLHAYKHSGE